MLAQARQLRPVVPSQAEQRGAERQPGDVRRRALALGEARIAHRLTDIAYVDMRYSNGFAVGWRNAASHLVVSPAAKEPSPNA